jgi:hypothetical protein
VDNEWRFAPDQETAADKEGNINNFIDLSRFKADKETMPSRQGAWGWDVLRCVCAGVGLLPT